jgi:hypothetical protein
VAAEDAIRNYLSVLKDPARLRDEKRINDLTAQLEATEDPLERLRIRAELRQAEQVGPEQFENDFVTHAKAWADANGVTAEAFQAEGVPADVLRTAGFPVRGRTGRKRAAPGRRRVSSDEVLAAIPKRGRFTTTDLRNATGASLGTVRRVIQELVSAGEVEEAGPIPTEGRGRGPMQYRRR